MKKHKERDHQGAKGKNIGCNINVDDPIHPIQFWGNTESRRSDPLLPDRKLWAAVLSDAIECLGGRVSAESSKANRAEEIENAREWFLSDRMEVGSFLWVCKMLDLASDLILKEVVRLYRDKEKAA